MRKLFKILNDQKYIYSTREFRAHCFSGQATSCSKVLKDIKYFNTVKSFRATLFSQSNKVVQKSE